MWVYACFLSVQMEWVFIMKRVSSQGSSAAQRRRMALGVVILLLVDVIWVASSELTSVSFFTSSTDQTRGQNDPRRRQLHALSMAAPTDLTDSSSSLLQYIFRRQEYNKPFFSTFTKTSMFVLYLLGFLLWRPWRQQCTGTLKRRRSAFVSKNKASPDRSRTQTWMLLSIKRCFHPAVC